MRSSRARLTAALALCVGVGLAAAPASADPVAAAPDPGGNESAKVPVPPTSGKKFGFVDNQGIGPDRPITPQAFASMSAGAGANAARIEVDWRYVELQRGEWNEGRWAAYRSTYDALIARGITPVITIGYAPPWARAEGRLCTGHSCRYPPSRTMNAEWGRFSAEVARRFPAAVIEIWNEPNLPQFWQSGPNPSRFAELQAIAYAAIKSVRPSTVVLAGGVNNAQAPYTIGVGSGSAIPLREFLDAAYAATPSIRGHMDAISVHASSQDLEYGAGTLLGKVFEDVRWARQRHGDDGRRIWVTELGLSTSGPRARTERQQADGLLRQYRRLMTMPDVDAMLILALLDVPNTAWSNENQGYGVRYHQYPGFPFKLAYCAFASRANPAPPAGCPPPWEPHVPGGSGGTGGGTGSGGTGGSGGSGGSGGTGGSRHDTGGLGGQAGVNCTRRLASITRRMATSRGAQRRLLRQRYRRVMRRCVPCERRQATLRRQVRRTSGATKRRAKRRLARVRRRCAPCRRRLQRLQLATLRSAGHERAFYLQRHEQVRRRCRPRRR